MLDMRTSCLCSANIFKEHRFCFFNLRIDNSLLPFFLQNEAVLKACSEKPPETLGAAVDGGGENDIGSNQ